jgi:hypothetical protein
MSKLQGLVEKDAPLLGHVRIHRVPKKLHAHRGWVDRKCSSRSSNGSSNDNGRNGNSTRAPAAAALAHREPGNFTLKQPGIGQVQAWRLKNMREVEKHCLAASSTVLVINRASAQTEGMMESGYATTTLTNLCMTRVAAAEKILRRQHRAPDISPLTSTQP